MYKHLIIVILILSNNLWADTHNIRNCMLLPITDSAGNALGFKVFEQLEESIKEQKWCHYKSSADLIAIFSRYRERLKEHLQDPVVLKTVADKLQTGTLIRVDLRYEVNSIEVVMEILGEQGDEIYFKENALIENPEPTKIVSVIKNWLEMYDSNLPYDGKVLGVLGDQITFSLPGNKKYGVGQEFKVRRYIAKTKHKLLKTVVEWDSSVIAQGKIFSISKDQALGIIKIYNSEKKVEAGDWVRLETYIADNILDDKKFEDADKYRFGKLGVVNLRVGMGSSNVGTSPATGSVKVTGLTYGLGVDGEAWITRNYFATGEFTRQVGTLKKSAGNPELETVNITSGSLKIAGGYKYLPMGFFYGPQVNLYAGYARYYYNVEESAVDGFGENSISGIMLGVGGNMPIQKQIRVFGKGEIIPFSSFDDLSKTYSSNKTSGSMYFNIGMQYQYDQFMSFDGGMEVINNSARFNSGVKQVNYRDTIFKIGSTFVF
jgi:hypothetical protein